MDANFKERSITMGYGNYGSSGSYGMVPSKPSNIFGAVNIDVLAECLNLTLNEHGESDLFIMKDKWKRKKEMEEVAEKKKQEVSYGQVTPKNIASSLQDQLRKGNCIRLSSMVLKSSKKVFVCDYCNVARQSNGQYVKEDCDNCVMCGSCDEWINHTCPGCEYSGVIGGNGKFSDRKENLRSSVYDDKLQEVIDNPSKERDRGKFISKLI